MRRSIRNGVLLGAAPALILVLAVACWLTGETPRNHLSYVNLGFFVGLVGVLPMTITIVTARHLDLEDTGRFQKMLVEACLALTVFLVVICAAYFPALHIMGDINYAKGR